MKKATLWLLLAASLCSLNSLATDKGKCQKDEKKCTMGGPCCKKTNTRAALLKAKAKPAATVVKKA